MAACRGYGSLNKQVAINHGVSNHIFPYFRSQNRGPDLQEFFHLILNLPRIVVNGIFLLLRL